MPRPTVADVSHDEPVVFRNLGFWQFPGVGILREPAPRIARLPVGFDMPREACNIIDRRRIVLAKTGVESPAKVPLGGDGGPCVPVCVDHQRVLEREVGWGDVPRTPRHARNVGPSDVRIGGEKIGATGDPRPCIFIAAFGVKRLKVGKVGCASVVHDKRLAFRGSHGRSPKPLLKRRAIHDALARVGKCFGTRPYLALPP